MPFSKFSKNKLQGAREPYIHARSFLPYFALVLRFAMQEAL
jgi:hypothetical protein